MPILANPCRNDSKFGVNYHKKLVQLGPGACIMNPFTVVTNLTP